MTIKELLIYMLYPFHSIKLVFDQCILRTVLMCYFLFCVFQRNLKLILTQMAFDQQSGEIKSYNEKIRLVILMVTIPRRQFKQKTWQPFVPHTLLGTAENHQLINGK